MLTNDQIKRYSRQLLLPQIAVNGQEKIINSKVLVIGAGGLGSPCLLYLCAAGVGNIGVVDYDVVELNNLHRQIIHSEMSVGTQKADSACQTMRNLNSLVNCTPFNVLIDRTNAIDIISGFDVVVDCSDNVSTRYLINDACVLLGKPLVSASALRLDGQVFDLMVDDYL